MYLKKFYRYLTAERNSHRVDSYAISESESEEESEGTKCSETDSTIITGDSEDSRLRSKPGSGAALPGFGKF